ncbi:hypothetical protein [uncultured Rubinisphaera sp.]|uniref:hypothetical protein n=1 Tax=uncultured Rubinisphaera sp. TaxID=1678686 RepID=UPI0030DD68A2
MISYAGRIGIEVEYLLLTSQGQAPATELLTQFYQEFVQRGWKAESADTPPRLVVKTRIENSEIVLKNDFATCILEFVFPPFEKLEELRKFWENSIAVAREIADSLDMSLHRQAVYPTVPVDFDYRLAIDDPDGSRLQKYLNRPVIDSPYFARNYPAAICAAQVSLDLTFESFLDLLPGLYEFEYLVPLLFTTGQEFQTQSNFSVRSLIIQNNWHDVVNAGFPADLAGLISELTQRGPTGGRHLSNLVPRGANRIEFRSADTQPDLESLAKLIAFRLMSLTAAQQVQKIDSKIARIHFLRVCQDGICDPCRIQTHHELYREACLNIPQSWQKAGQTVLDAMESLMQSR